MERDSQRDAIKKSLYHQRLLYNEIWIITKSIKNVDIKGEDKPTFAILKMMTKVIKTTAFIFEHHPLIRSDIAMEEYIKTETNNH